MQSRHHRTAQDEPSSDVDARIVAPTDSAHRTPPSATASGGDDQKGVRWIDCTDHEDGNKNDGDPPNGRGRHRGSHR
jgi:hypothetical protein